MSKECFKEPKNRGRRMTGKRALAVQGGERSAGATPGILSIVSFSKFSESHEQGPPANSRSMNCQYHPIAK